MNPLKTEIEKVKQEIETLEKKENHLKSFDYSSIPYQYVKMLATLSALQLAEKIEQENLKKLKERININGNLSFRIIENESGEFEHKHDKVLNNIVIEIIDEVFE
jgi:lipase chaperone LimK